MQNENNNKEPLEDPGQNGPEEEFENPWSSFLARDMWKVPLSIFGIMVTVVSMTFMVIGFIVDIFGIITNPFIGVWTYMVLPFCLIIGIILIPIGVFRRKKQRARKGVEPARFDLETPEDRRYVTLFIVMSVICVSTLIIAGYEGYRFTDSNYFCALLCHQVMGPEYSSYQKSPHSRIACIECHIGRGEKWFVQAKLSGIPMAFKTMADSYDKPIPTPVTNLRPAQQTCEKCHWPDKFQGKIVKKFYHFDNNDQKNPTVTEISLHIGGRNPYSGKFEGIHWHVSQNVKIRYLAADRKLTRIADIRVERPDGTRDEFHKEGVVAQEGYELTWRVMDCLDCHNRPTHIFQTPEEVVDLGMANGLIDPDLPGMREDSLIVLQRKYDTREDARERIADHFYALRGLRGEGEDYEAAIKKAADYLTKAYMDNVWPNMNIWWGTYKSNLGHQNTEQGYGCFRCHDGLHVDKDGEAISQDCDLCHDTPVVEKVKLP